MKWRAYLFICFADHEKLLPSSHKLTGVAELSKRNLDLHCHCLFHAKEMAAGRQLSILLRFSLRTNEHSRLMNNFACRWVISIDQEIGALSFPVFTRVTWSFVMLVAEARSKRNTEDLRNEDAVSFTGCRVEREISYKAATCMAQHSKVGIRALTVSFTLREGLIGLENDTLLCRINAAFLSDTQRSTKLTLCHPATAHGHCRGSR